MSPGPRIGPALVALLMAACAEEPSTAVLVGELDEPPDLQLTLPAVSPDLLVEREFVVVGAPDVPALVPESSPARTPDEASIWNPYTDVAFWPGQMEAWGEHDFTGNKARVEVTADVRHNGVVIGSRTGSKEVTHLFMNPLAHHIIGNVLINTDADCGLTGDAKTDHSAWWEMALGAGPSAFSRQVIPTYSGLEAQPSCQPVYGSGGGGGGGGAELIEFTCWLWFSYDMYTLEVLDIHGTWCTGGG